MHTLIFNTLTINSTTQCCRRLITLVTLIFFCNVIVLAQADSSENQREEIKNQPDTLIEYIKAEIKEDNDDEQTSAQSKAESSQKLLANTALTSDYNEAYYQLKELNAGLPSLDPPPNLQTPMSTLEFFNSAMLRNDYVLGAYALNLNAYEVSEQGIIAPELSKKLDYLLSEKSLYVFDDLPDRPDGLIDPPIGSSNPVQGIPRRAIKLGYIDYKSRRVPITLERVYVEDNAPVWVFSSQTVTNINVLYAIHKPAEFETYLPDWLKGELAGISVWEVMVLFLFMIITLGVGHLISNLVIKLISIYINRVQKHSENNQLSLHYKALEDLFHKISMPLTITISFAMMFTLVSGALPKVQSIATSTRPIIWIGLVFSVLWLGVRIINFFANRYEDYQINALDEKEFNKRRVRMTYLSIFRRIFIFVMILVGIWVSLAEFADLEGLGTTLLTSAGILGAVIGIAAQPTLGNIIAGFQVAVTQPVRIGDTVMLDGTWCEVEDLRYTYAVLKTWDDRRLIVPMKYFVTEILENWSHTDSDQSAAIYLYVDYGADIDAIEEKFYELATSNDLWDDDVEPEFLVTSVNEETIKLRCKVSSDSPGNAWALECEVRKQMLAYLSEHHAGHLPTERITMAPRDDSGKWSEELPTKEQSITS